MPAQGKGEKGGKVRAASQICVFRCWGRVMRRCLPHRIRLAAQLDTPAAAPQHSHPGRHTLHVFVVTEMSQYVLGW